MWGLPLEACRGSRRTVAGVKHSAAALGISARSDGELVELTQSHGGTLGAGWWDRVREHSLGWVTARTEAGQLVGFVNVAWDGGDHAFLIDTKIRPTHQRQGFGTAVVGRAIAEARAAGCEWLFVDFQPPLAAFYIDACGFGTTPAGLVHLPTWKPQ
jgi:GNAT superfamily N-acetyltransferase